MSTDVRTLKNEYQFGFHDRDESVFRAQKGLTREIVETISEMKGEPEWMRDYRLRALEIFLQKPIPKWIDGLNTIDFDNIYYYVQPAGEETRTWEDVPETIKKTFDRIGIPEAEKKYLAGVGAQYDSEVVYHSLKEDLERLGVIFMSPDTALQEYPDLVQEYFGTIIPPEDNKFAALNTAVWSGGSFVFIPSGVKVDIPLQAYFRINSKDMGQFERTLIIAEEGAEVTYIEGCSSPTYSANSLHSAVVEIICKPGSKVHYTTIQNWFDNVYNLVTKRAIAYEDAQMVWTDANLGSHITAKYPSVYLAGEGAYGEVLSLAFAGKGQHQDTGAKMIHAAPHTSSIITAKSISKDGGRSSYRGLIKVTNGSKGSKSKVVCDALILDKESRSDTYPVMEVDEAEVTVAHEATVSRIQDEQLFYLMSRGLTEEAASVMIVNGFIEPLVKELPMEYAVELNRLIELQMEGSVG